jgi:hypothetical protein
VTRSVVLLAGGTLLFWLATAYPAYLLGGEDMVALSAAAAVICLIPTAATLVWSHRTRQSAPEVQLVAALGGTGVRILVVIALGLVLYQSLDFFHRRSFWIWVIVHYLVTLTLEMGLILTRPGLGVSRGQGTSERET